MLIVLEGVDKAGKSTLAKSLSKKLGWMIDHFGKPGSDPASEYARYLISEPTNKICDRFYVGELVYGPLLRGHNSMTPLEVVTIERLCRLTCSILVHVNPPLDTVQNRLKKLGDELISRAQNARAYEMFKTVCPGRKFILNSAWDGSGDIDAIADNLAKIAVDYSLIHDAARSICTGIGSIIGDKYVFVGESINPKTTWLNLPFDKGPSAEYLLRAMLRSGIDESKVYMCNADKLTVPEIQILTADGEARFIALGNKARDTLEKMQIGFVHVPHPQFWNRFHHGEIEIYADLIRMAVKEAPIYNVLNSGR